MYQTPYRRLLGMCVIVWGFYLLGCGSGPDNAPGDTPAPTGFQRLKTLLTPAPQNTVATLDALVQQFLAQGQHTLAQQHAQQALRIREDAWGPEHRQVAAGLDQLAAVYSAQGKYAEAEPLLQQALAIREKALGTEHQEVAASLDQYARLLRQLQREPEAQPLAARAQAIRLQLAQTKGRSG